MREDLTFVISNKYVEGLNKNVKEKNILLNIIA